ncbi:hypothetical protein [Cupriavidus sp. GA3-3]|nr:hypothetical protein [Cupriavidus sp. GA3-3]
MNKFSEIDLHSNNSVVVVSDEADRVIYQRQRSLESRRLSKARVA